MAVPAGTHRVVFDYDPPGLSAGVLVAVSAAMVTIGLVAWPRRRRDAIEATTQAPPAPR